MSLFIHVQVYSWYQTITVMASNHDIPFNPALDYEDEEDWDDLYNDYRPEFFEDLFEGGEAKELVFDPVTELPLRFKVMPLGEDDKPMPPPLPVEDQKNFKLVRERFVPGAPGLKSRTRRTDE
jgi:hypothetical protein